MTIIKIEPNENGSHDNQTINGVTPETFPIPEGYAVVPKELDDLAYLENYPFGVITVETIGGLPTVTSWTPLPIPEPEPGSEAPQYSDLQLLAQQVTDLELMVLGGVSNV